MQDSGSFDRTRFSFLVPDEFECQICFKIMNDPVKCNGCDENFCIKCICYLWRELDMCPNRCDTNQHEIKRSSKRFRRKFQSLIVDCEFCKKPFPMKIIGQHQLECEQKKCLMWDVCHKHISEDWPDIKVCNPTCLLLHTWQ